LLLLTDRGKCRWI